MGNSKRPRRNMSSHKLSQSLLELDASLLLIERLQELKKIVGDVGPNNPVTEIDIETHLSAALGAASHWRLETQIELSDAQRHSDNL